MRWRAAGSAVGVLAAGTAAAGAFLVARVLRAERDAVRPVVLTPTPGQRTALVVFGAETLPTGPSRELASRLSHTVRLWHAGVADVVVASGGVDGELDEVAAMVTALRGAGLPPDAVLEGRPGGNTRQTLATMARMYTEEGLGPWIAVSTPYHARRIRDEAHRAGVEVVVSGPADSPETINRAVHRSRVMTEAVATLYYVLPTSLTSRLRTTTGTLRHSLPLLLAGRAGDITPGRAETGSP
ncbi:MAG: YdcF family protein [Actinobacteria bacterium]|nr:YdcF family protein [Actinomycetota bacterium]